jgi:Holliday junction resolvase RusA-like endonuclease
VTDTAAVTPDEGVRFRVLGVPAPQGSKTAWMNPRTGKAQMSEASGPRLKSWRAAVTEEAAARRAVLGRALDGPITLSITFRFPMPAGRPAALRHRGYARKQSAPDLDKLLRGVLDALTSSGLIADDARVCELHGRKVEVGAGQWTGAELLVRETSL